MSDDRRQMVSTIVSELEEAWNNADGDAFARPFEDAADFVNIRGEHIQSRDAIGRGDQGIFNSICEVSAVRYELGAVRVLAPTVMVAQVKSTLQAPRGPLAGEHRALFSMVLVQANQDGRIASFHNTLVA